MQAENTNRYVLCLVDFQCTCSIHPFFVFVFVPIHANVQSFMFTSDPIVICLCGSFLWCTFAFIFADNVNDVATSDPSFQGSLHYFSVSNTCFLNFPRLEPSFFCYRFLAGKMHNMSSLSFVSFNSFSLRFLTISSDSIWDSNVGIRGRTVVTVLHLPCICEHIFALGRGGTGSPAYALVTGASGTHRRSSQYQNKI